MNGTTIAIIGVGAAGFLYWRSRQRQQEILAAAQLAPDPGLITKAGNTIKAVAPKIGSDLINVRTFTGGFEGLADGKLSTGDWSGGCDLTKGGCRNQTAANTEVVKTALTSANWISGSLAFK